MRRVVILGRGSAGKSTLARRLGQVSGLPVVELDALFWQPEPTAADPAQWAERQHELVRREAWILDGDLGPHDGALGVRLRAADTIIVLDFSFLRCAWRTVLRAREQANTGAGCGRTSARACQRSCRRFARTRRTPGFTCCAVHAPSGVLSVRCGRWGVDGAAHRDSA